MHKFLKLTGVSMLAVMTANGAHAAGYTCEELIEYTSCNTGYYLNDGTCIEGTTCGAGNYLRPYCPDGYDESNEADEADEYGEYGWCYSEDMNCSMEYWCVTDKDDCEDEGYTWFGPGCVLNDEGYYGSGTDLFTPLSYTCTACAAGSYQNAAGQYSCITCPAGSECPTAGLSAATLCEAGKYSDAGATACSTCLPYSYTNANGQTVTAPATSDVPAAGISACYVDSDTYFTDVTGTWHFKENCEYFDFQLPSSIESQADCDILSAGDAAGEWWYVNSTCNSSGDDDGGRENGDMDLTSLLSKQECLAIAYTEWTADGMCRCVKPDDGFWTVDSDGFHCENMN